MRHFHEGLEARGAKSERLRMQGLVCTLRAHPLTHPPAHPPTHTHTHTHTLWLGTSGCGERPAGQDDDKLQQSCRITFPDWPMTEATSLRVLWAATQAHTRTSPSASPRVNGCLRWQRSQILCRCTKIGFRKVPCPGVYTQTHRVQTQRRTNAQTHRQIQTRVSVCVP